MIYTLMAMYSCHSVSNRIGKGNQNLSTEVSCFDEILRFVFGGGVACCFQGAYQFLKINLRPFLRRFKTDFSRI